MIATILCTSSSSVLAVQNLNASSQTKVNNAMAKAWQKGGNPNDPALQKRVVNIGTVQPGQKAPKDIVVTTKEVINVCK